VKRLNLLTCWLKAARSEVTAFCLVFFPLHCVNFIYFSTMSINWQALNRKQLPSTSSQHKRDACHALQYQLSQRKLFHRHHLCPNLPTGKKTIFRHKKMQSPTRMYKVEILTKEQVIGNWLLKLKKNTLRYINNCNIKVNSKRI